MTQKQHKEQQSSCNVHTHIPPGNRAPHEGSPLPPSTMSLMNHSVWGRGGTDRAEHDLFTLLSTIPAWRSHCHTSITENTAHIRLQQGTGTGVRLTYRETPLILVPREPNQVRPKSQQRVSDRSSEASSWQVHLFLLCGPSAHPHPGS